MNLELCSITCVHSLERKRTSVCKSLMVQDDPMIKPFIDKGILGKHFLAVKKI